MLASRLDSCTVPAGIWARSACCSLYRSIRERGGAFGSTNSQSRSGLVAQPGAHERIRKAKTAHLIGISAAIALPLRRPCSSIPCARSCELDSEARIRYLPLLTINLARVPSTGVLLDKAVRPQKLEQAPRVLVDTDALCRNQQRATISRT